MAVGGAAANLTTNALDGDIHSAQDVAESLIVGGVQGALAVPLAAVDMVSQAGAIKDNIEDGDYAGAAGHGALAALDAVTVVGGTKLLGGKGGCKTHSFAPATAVLMADGDTKHIADIQVGDKVIATDPETGTTTAQQVEVLYENFDTDLIDLFVELPDGSSTVIKTTQHHPFWDQTTGAWVDAGDLQTDHHLRDAAGKPSVTVTAVRPTAGVQHMLDLTVAELHTYYVLAGAAPVLVHNCGGKHRAEGESGQKDGYQPQHLRPDALDRIPLQHAAVGAADGALNKWDASLANKALGYIPEGSIKQQLGIAGRVLYGAYYGRKAFRESGGGYPAVHRIPENYQGRHRVYQGRHRAE